MLCMDRMPEGVTEALPALGIDAGRLELSCFVDRDRSGKPAEGWLLADRENLFVLNGCTERMPDGRTAWKNESKEQYPLSGVGRLAVEERRSTAVLVADLAGETVLFAFFTNKIGRAHV